MIEFPVSEINTQLMVVDILMTILFIRLRIKIFWGKNSVKYSKMMCCRLICTLNLISPSSSIRLIFLMGEKMMSMDTLRDGHQFTRGYDAVALRA